MEHTRILVMMSAYNGEKYLEEQLESIFSQADVEVHLLVRDDGSGDGTLGILRRYRDRYPGSVDIMEGENIGWKKSFHTLVRTAAERFSSFDYFAFSDQDDVWLPEKLKKGVEGLRTLPEGPNLYCSNQYYYKDGEVLGLVNKGHIVPTVKGCLLRNYATGCTIVFNNSLLRCFSGKMPEIILAHDYWCYMVATLCGHTFVDSDSYIHYRQHATNQIGSKTSWADNWKRRLKSLSSLLGNHDRERMAKELLRLYGNSMSEEGRKAAVKIADYRKSIGNRWKLLTDNEYTLNNPSNDFWLKLRILAGRL